MTKSLRVFELLVMVINELGLNPVSTSVPFRQVAEKAYSHRKNDELNKAKIYLLVLGELRKLETAGFVVLTELDTKIQVQPTELGYKRYMKRLCDVDAVGAVDKKIVEVRVIYKSSPKVYRYTKNFNKIDKKNLVKYHVIYA